MLMNSRISYVLNADMPIVDVRPMPPLVTPVAESVLSCHAYPVRAPGPNAP